MFHKLFRQHPELAEAIMFPYAVKVTVPSGNPTISTENLCDLLKNCFSMCDVTCVPSDVNPQITNTI